MRAFLTTLTLATGLICSAALAADSVSIGNAKFDFDAPSPPLTPAERDLFARYKAAVDRHDATALMALQDDSLKRCAFVAQDVMLRDLATPIPANAKVRFFPSTADMAREMGFGDLAYLSAPPSAVLGISGSTASKTEIKSVTILRPVRQAGARLTLIAYCLTPKGEAVFEKKNH